MAYYSILLTTLENQCADGQANPFADMQLKFIQLEKRHTSIASSRHERANLAALNPNPLAASSRHHGKTKPRGATKSGNPKKHRRQLVQLGDDQLPWPHKKSILQAWPR